MRNTMANNPAESPRSTSFGSMDNEVFTVAVNDDADGWYFKGTLPMTFPRPQPRLSAVSASSSSNLVDSDKEDETMPYTHINFASSNSAYGSNDHDVDLNYKPSAAVVNQQGGPACEDVGCFDMIGVRDMGKFLSRMNKNRKSLSELDIASLVAAEKCGLGGVDTLVINNSSSVDSAEDDEKTEQGKSKDEYCENDRPLRSKVPLPEDVDLTDPATNALMLESVTNNHIDLTRRLHRLGVPLQTKLFRIAAGKGHIGVLQYMLAQLPLPLAAKLARVAAPHATPNTLRFLRLNYAIESGQASK